MVVVARSPEDVAEVVKFVKMEDVELSVRSGGHSYACTSSRVIRPASLDSGILKSCFMYKEIIDLYDHC